MQIIKDVLPIHLTLRFWDLFLKNAKVWYMTVPLHIFFLVVRNSTLLKRNFRIVSDFEAK